MTLSLVAAVLELTMFKTDVFGLDLNLSNNPVPQRRQFNLILSKLTSSTINKLDFNRLTLSTGWQIILLHYII